MPVCTLWLHIGYKHITCDKTMIRKTSWGNKTAFHNITVMSKAIKPIQSGEGNKIPPIMCPCILSYINI